MGEWTEGSSEESCGEENTENRSEWKGEERRVGKLCMEKVRLKEGKRDAGDSCDTGGQREEKRKQEAAIRTEGNKQQRKSPIASEPRNYGRVMTTTALTRNKAQLFPTARRPVRREIPDRASVGDEAIEQWFNSTSLRLGAQLTIEEKARAMRMLYTWQDVFETDLLRIRQTDLIEHAIVLMPGAVPHRARIPLYTEEEIAFCRRLIPKMEEAGLIFRCDSEWGARTKFPLKPRADTLPKDARLRMVHNFIPLNRVTEKSRYPCPRIEQIVYTVLKKGKRFFFTSDAANSYWAIPVRAGDETKLGFVTPYGMYCYKVMGQGLTGGTHTYSRFRDLVFGVIPEGFEEKEGVRLPLQGEDSLIGDYGEFAFDGMIDDSYGSATSFEAMYRFLHERFFPRCNWGPMYLKDSKSCFFMESLDFVGLEAGPNGLRPSLRKRGTILEWPTPTNQEEVHAFCYLTPFLRRFIPGRAELVRILKYGEAESSGEAKGIHQRVRKKEDTEGEFTWDRRKEVAFQALKQAIANNAMAAPDPAAQYHLAVDASKMGIGGVLFQLDGIPPGSEALSNASYRAAERIIMFISFRLSDAESRYSNSEREALAVIRCLAEVRWMVIASPYPVFVYTDHEALKTLLTGVDNDAHGRIAKWQERLSEYDIRLLHRSAKTHFIGIADGLSRLPTRLLSYHTAEDVEGLRPFIGGIVPVSGIAMDVKMNAGLAVALRLGQGFWQMGRSEGESECWQDSKGSGMEVKWEAFLGALAVEKKSVGEMGDANGFLREAASDMRRRNWQKWLESGMYGKVVQARLDEEEDGALGVKRMEMGRSEKKILERAMRRYVLVEAVDPKLFYREKNGELASCVLESDVEKVLTDLHEGHGHFASSITLARAHGKVYWPSRANDIARWVASCEACQRVTKIQKAGQLRSILQFKPMDMIGMDYVGPINPPCQATGYVYILIVIDYFSRFLWGIGVHKADQVSTIKALLNHVIPVVGWPLTVYTDNGGHFTGALIAKMWTDHGVMHFPSAVSHPQSVGLSERYVQMLIGRIRASCINQGSSGNWGQEIRNAVLSINTRYVKVQGYTPAEILLGFNPSVSRISDGNLCEWAKQQILESGDILEPSEDNITSYIDQREERSVLATGRLGRRQDGLCPRKTAGYKIPKEGDLVLLRDFQQAKDKGRKLDPRWSAPRILERISKSGVSAHVRQLHHPPGQTKRYHFDDLLVYVPRTSDYPSGFHSITRSGAVVYERGAMGDVNGIWHVGQRGFDLSDLD